MRRPAEARGCLRARCVRGPTPLAPSFLELSTLAARDSLRGCGFHNGSPGGGLQRLRPLGGEVWGGRVGAPRRLTETSAGAKPGVATAKAARGQRAAVPSPRRASASHTRGRTAPGRQRRRGGQGGPAGCGSPPGKQPRPGGQARERGRQHPLQNRPRARAASHPLARSPVSPSGGSGRSLGRLMPEAPALTPSCLTGYVSSLA